MEETSMVFSVDSGEVSEDEDELQRREELHQLLSEQLQDDLLEDSISTATSLCLTPTPPRRHSNPSTPPHQHSDTSTPPYQHSITPVKVEATADNTSAYTHTVRPEEGVSTDSCDSHVIFPLEGSPGVLPRPEVWNYYTHTSPQGTMGGQPRGGGHLQPPPSSAVGCGSAEGLTHSAGGGDCAGEGDHGTGKGGRGGGRRGRVDVFSGTSQAYNSCGIGREPSKPPTPEYSAQQLEVLYHARGRRIEMLSQQVSAQAEEGERHVRILRHEKGLLEEERDQLLQQVEGLEELQQTLDREVAALRGQLGAEQSHSQALEGSQRELVSRLQAAEASVESLTNQVSELTKTEALTRVRENYASALAHSSHQHQQHTLTLQHELDAAHAEIEQQNETISQLQSQLQALPSLQEESRPARAQPAKSAAEGDPLAKQLCFGTLEEGVEQGEESLTRRIVELSARVEDLQFQLSTAEGELGETRERMEQAEGQLSSQAAKLTELVAENQQLSLQLEAGRRMEVERRVLAEKDKRDALEKCRTACLQLHEDAAQRLREAATDERERAKHEHARQLSQIRVELAGVQEQYVKVCREKDELCRQLEGKSEGVPSEGVMKEWEEKKATTAAALEEVRSQCLAQQEEAVAKAVGTARGKWVEQQEEAVRAAVEAARGAWQQRLLEESKASVEQALGAWQREAELQLAKTKHQWEQEHKTEIEKVRNEAAEVAVVRAKQKWEGEKEVAVTQAIREARSQWLREREAGLGGRVEAAVAAAQQLWRAKQREELERQGAELERAHKMELEQLRAELEKEQHRAVEQAIKESQQECESEGMVSLELALADERGRLQEETRRSWHKGRQSLLAAAHREWTAAQEVVTRAEVKRAKREWEEGRKEEVKVAVEEALSQARQHYEGVLGRGRGEAVKEWEGERERLEKELRQMEDRVASLMQGRGSLPKVDGGSQTGAQGVMDAALVRELLQQTMAALGRDMQALLKEVIEESSAHSRQEALMASRASAQEVQSYYLQCLHQLLNGEKRVLLEAESNTRPHKHGENASRRGSGLEGRPAAPPDQLERMAAPVRKLPVNAEQRSLAGTKAGKLRQEQARTSSSYPKTSSTATALHRLKPAASGSGIKRNLSSSVGGTRTAARTQSKAQSSHRNGGQYLLSSHTKS